MQYSNQIDINQPIDKVVALMENPAYMKEWQPGFISFESISGTPGQTGAQSRLRYKMGKRKVELVETIIHRNLPHEFHATYETRGVFNTQRNFFTALSDNQTRWVAETDFKFSGFMKILGWLMPGAFKKQSQQYLDLFKVFAEKQ
jgi:carbon monoxide dehydrogenase subunit G